MDSACKLDSTSDASSEGHETSDLTPYKLKDVAMSSVRSLYDNVVWKFLHSREVNSKVAELRKQMEGATDYETWVEAAVKLDILEGKEAWKTEISSDLYDWQQVLNAVNQLRSLRAKEDVHGMMFALRAGICRNFAGISNARLWQHSNTGSKHLIEDYVKEVSTQIEWLAENDFPGISFDKRLAFFSEVRQAYGRSALLLSGGASLGVYHIGVVKSLVDNNCLPNVICGSSAGAIITAILGVHTDEELASTFEGGHWNLHFFDKRRSLRRKLHRLFSKGVLMDVRKLQACLEANLGDLTFREAHERTQRIINITACSTNKHGPPHLLNYLTTPNVLIRSAAAASCALKFLFEPVELLAKDREGNVVPFNQPGVTWSDGSVETDLPMTRLAELFNVNHFIVSQVNPHVVPFLARDSSVPNTLKKIVLGELKHRLLQLNDLNLIPEVFSGLVNLVEQKYTGNITILPVHRLSDYLQVVNNPTEEMINQGTFEGSRNTFPHINMIWDQLHIELTIEQCLRRLKASINWYTDDE